MSCKNDDDKLEYHQGCRFCDFASRSKRECEQHAECLECSELAEELSNQRRRKYCNYCALFKVSSDDIFEEGDYNEYEDNCLCCGVEARAEDSSDDDDSGSGSSDDEYTSLDDEYTTDDDDDKANDDVLMPHSCACNFCDFASPSIIKCSEHALICKEIEKLTQSRRKYCNYCSLFCCSPAEAYEEGDYKDEEDCKRCGINPEKESERSFAGYAPPTNNNINTDGGKNNDTTDNNNIVNDRVLFKFDGNNVNHPRNGEIYQPLEVSQIITSLTVKGTSKRAELIKLLLQKKLVKGKSKLYETVKKYEEGTTFKLTWNEIGRPSKDAKRKKGEQLGLKPGKRLRYTEAVNVNPNRKPANIKPSSIHAKIVHVPSNSINKTIREQIRYDIGEDTCSAGKHIDKYGWRGELYLDVTPIYFDEIWGNQASHSSWLPIIKAGKLKNPKVDLTDPVRLDICTFLGQRNKLYADNEWITPVGVDKGISRLYFNPKEFPPPKDMKEGGSNENEVFSKLKNYIMVSSTKTTHPVPLQDRDSKGHQIGKSNSAVVCYGGKKYYNKIFRCIHAYTKQPEGKSTQICPMNFKVCWDEHGYYINLTSKLRKIRTKGLHDYKLLPGTKTVGCPWHCCESNELMTKVSERKETVLQVNCSS